jgi:hypothetical protein
LHLYVLRYGAVPLANSSLHLLSACLRVKAVLAQCPFLARWNRFFRLSRLSAVWVWMRSNSGWLSVHLSMLLQKGGNFAQERAVALAFDFDLPRGHGGDLRRRHLRELSGVREGRLNCQFWVLDHRFSAQATTSSPRGWQGLRYFRYWPAAARAPSGQPPCFGLVPA